MQKKHTCLWLANLALRFQTMYRLLRNFLYFFYKTIMSKIFFCDVDLCQTVHILTFYQLVVLEYSYCRQTLDHTHGSVKSYTTTTPRLEKTQFIRFLSHHHNTVLRHLSIMLENLTKPNKECPIQTFICLFILILTFSGGQLWTLWFQEGHRP